MVQYYNFSDLQNSEGYMGFLRNLSVMSNYWIGVTLLLFVFFIPLMTMYRKDGDFNGALNVSSLFTMLLGIFFYLTGITPNSLVIYLPGLLFVVSIVIDRMNKGV